MSPQSGLSTTASSSRSSSELSGIEKTLIKLIEEGTVLPLISNIISNELVFSTQEALIERWAIQEMGYPADKLTSLLDNHNSLHSMIQRKKADPQSGEGADAIETLYLEFLTEEIHSRADQQLVKALKTHLDYNKINFAEKAARLQMVSSEISEQNPLMLLAKMPIPIYLTTSYHTFIEVALKNAGKTPTTAVCPWWWEPKTQKEKDDPPPPLPPNPFDDPKYTPKAKEPLVYHLHGLDTTSRSLVLTEADYLDFLVAISQFPGLIPPTIRGAIAESPLLMLGYSLANWDFRVLFHGLIKNVEHKLRERRATSVFIQLSDDEDEKTYLRNYLREAKLNVLWGKTGTVLYRIYLGWEARYHPEGNNIGTAETLPEPVSTPEGAVDELTMEQKLALVDKLLEAQALQNPGGITAIVQQLRSDIRSNITHNGNPRVYILNIVNVVLAYSKGLDELLTLVRYFERDSQAMQAIDKLLATYRETK